MFIGELHGSNETPAAFRNLVCDALAHGKYVTVALERQTSEQAALEGILTAKDLPAAQAVLLRQPGWKNGMDGRASGAIPNIREIQRSSDASDLGVQRFLGTKLIALITPRFLDYLQ